MNKLSPIRPFCPNFLLRNPHIQTIVGAYCRSRKGVTFERRRVHTPDDDFVDLDFACVDGVLPLGETSPLVVLLHGLSGSAQSIYAYEIYRQLAQAGIRAVGMNYRSCSGEVNKMPRTYHAGATEDVVTVIEWLCTHYPYAPLGIVGVSLGANILLKFLGEAKRDVAAAVAISPPFDLFTSSQVLAHGSGRIYDRNILWYLKQNMEQKSHQVSHLVDMKAIQAAKTIHDFDVACTAPLHGFKSVGEYYEQCSSKQFLSSIYTPTLIIRSIDDPFLDPYDVPYKVIEKNPYLFSAITPYGGHVGFAEGILLHRLTWWAHEETTQFLSIYLPIKTHAN